MTCPGPDGSFELQRQQQVPRFYLRRFSTRKGKLAVYDRTQQRYFGASIEKVAVEKSSYDFGMANGSVSKEAEKALGRVEEVAKAALDAIDHRPASWSGPGDNARIHLAIFIAVQAVRTREYRHALEEMEDVWYRMQIDLNLATEARRVSYAKHLTGRSPTPAELEAARLICNSMEKLRFKLNRRDAILKMFQESERVAPFIASRPWTLLVSKKRAFVTSDRPVTLWRRRTEGDRHYGVGTITAEAIYFPLDSHKLLILGSGVDGGWREVTPTAHEIRHVNYEVAHWSRAPGVSSSGA